MAELEDQLAKLLEAVQGLAKRMDAMDAEQKASKDADERPASPSMQEAENARKKEEYDALARADSIPGRIMANKRLRDDLDAKERILSQKMREQGPLTDRERNQMAETQARHDSVQQHFGRQAPPPMAGETPRSYRVRLLHDLKRYHPELKDANFAHEDIALLDVFEPMILDAALQEAKRPTLDLPEDGSLRKVVRKDESGRDVVTYFGKNTFVQKFAAPTVMKATKIYTQQELALASMVNSLSRKH